jgi:hypothetical protein
MTRLNRGLFTSLRGDWKTPKALYQALDAEFHFDHDPCPVKPKFDGLESDWGNVNFVNPPYGREIAKWIQKGFEENQKGKTVVFLLPSRTDTHWWHEFVMKATEIRFIRGRLRFDDHNNSAPFPSAIVVFGHRNYGKQDRQKER